MKKEMYIVGAMVDFITDSSDNHALMNTNLMIKNGKQLSKPDIEKIMKVGFDAMNQALKDISKEKQPERETNDEPKINIKNINNGNFN